MPNIIAEFSSGMESVCRPEELLACLHSAALDSGLFGEAAIKVRLAPFDHYLVGGKVSPFIHVTCLILDGRSPDQKKALTWLVLERLREKLGEALSITVDVRDVVRDSYAKHTG